MKVSIKRAVFIFILALVYLPGKAQQTDSVRIEGVVLADSGEQGVAKAGTTVVLMPYVEGGQYLSAKVNTDGSFSFSVPVSQPVLYDLKYRGMKMEVLLCPDEPVFKVSIVAGFKEVKTMKNIGSHQYEAYRAFKHINSRFYDKLHPLIVCKEEEKKCLALAKKEISDFNDELALLQKTFKGIFAATTLVPVAVIPEINTSAPLRKQLEAHFFDEVQFGDAGIFNMPELENKLSRYLEEIADTSAAARLAFIESLWLKAKADKKTQKNILALLIHNFFEGNREAYMISLVQWEAKHATLADEQPVMDSKIKLIARTIPGVGAAEVTGRDTSGQTQTLSAVVKKNKLTLLVFWSSDCPHCRKSLPELGRLYEKYHKNGLEILAASIEPDSAKWKQFVEQRKLPWMNMIIQPEATAHADYYIQYTPTFVLVNNQSIIIHRFLDLADLNKDIEDFLK